MSRTHTHTYTSTISAITREIERLFVIPKPFVRRSRRLETTDFRDLYTPRAFAETLLAAGRGRFVRVICHGISPIPADPTSRVYDKYIYINRRKTRLVQLFFGSVVRGYSANFVTVFVLRTHGDGGTQARRIVVVRRRFGYLPVSSVEIRVPKNLNMTAK